MKKLTALLLAAAMSLSLCACGGGDKPADSASSAAPAAPIQVDENLLSVEITLPASFFEGETEEEIIAGAEEEGFKSCTVNQDGSVTYTMSKAKHREVLEGFHTSMEETAASMVAGGGDDAMESFLDIQFNDDMSQFDIYVDMEKFSGLEAFAALGFFVTGAYYQAFAGVDMDKVDVVVNFIDHATNEVAHSMSYREFMESEVGAADAP